MSNPKSSFSFGWPVAALVALALLFVSLAYIARGPEFIGDASVYKYKVVITKVWFDSRDGVNALNPTEARTQRITYYTNEYSVKKTGLVELPLDFTIGKHAQFEKRADGNYYLHSSTVVSSYGALPSRTLDITVIEQSSRKVVFNSTRELGSLTSP